MKIQLTILTALTAAAALSACDTGPRQTQVEKAQQHLMDVRAQAAQDIQAAEKNLSDVIVSTEEKVTQAKATLNLSTDETKSEGTLSGSTTAADATPPPPRTR